MQQLKQSKVNEMEVVKAVSFKENVELHQLGFKHTVSSSHGWYLPTKPPGSSVGWEQILSQQDQYVQPCCVYILKKRLDPLPTFGGGTGLTGGFPPGMVTFHFCSHGL